MIWLRGWKSTDIMEKRFEIMLRWRDRLLSCRQCRMWEQRCTHTAPTVGDKFRAIFKRRSLRLMLIIAVLFLIAEFREPYRPGGFVKSQPHDSTIVQIKYKLTVSVVFVGLVWTLGYRWVALWAYFGVTIGKFIMGKRFFHHFFFFF